MNDRIYTRCPACGNDTLTINDDKHLLCTWMKCPDPTLIDRIGDMHDPSKDFQTKEDNEAFTKHVGSEWDTHAAWNAALSWEREKTREADGRIKHKIQELQRALASEKATTETVGAVTAQRDDLFSLILSIYNDAANCLTEDHIERAKRAIDRFPK